MNASEVIRLLRDTPGLSDREITDRLLGPGKAQQPVNGICRRLAEEGVVARCPRADRILGNYLTEAGAPKPPDKVVKSKRHLGTAQAEHEVQEKLVTYLRSQGWTIQHLARGHGRGVDIDAARGGQRWLIEVKGIGSRPEMRHNYFLNVLGQILGRMSDPDAKYSIAFPDHRQFRRLWSACPREAKSRTSITALFVVGEDAVEEVL